MIYDFFALTDTGRMRENNEDALSFDAEQGLAVLADGMGGYNAGEIASGIATTFITTELGRWLREASAQASDAEVKRAYRRLMSQHHPDKLVSKGLPEEMMKLATQKTHEIRQAYEMISAARKV